MSHAGIGKLAADTVPPFAQVMRDFTMPGRSIPLYDDLALLQARRNIFGAEQYREIVVEITERLDLLRLDGLTDEGKRAQERIGNLPTILARIARREAQSRRTIPLPFARYHTEVEV